MAYTWLPIIIAVIIAYIFHQYLYNVYLIADDKMAQSRDPRPDRCIFCKISVENRSEIIYQDESFIVFPDIRPATSHHYLVVPRQHLLNAKFLTVDDVPIIKRMAEIGKKVISEQGGDENKSRYGFHWHPFNSISHLHMHAISNEEEMTWVGQFQYKIKSYWFVKPEDVVLLLENKQSR